MNNLFTQEFWLTLSGQLSNWFIQEFPGLLILALILFAFFLLMNFSLGKVKKTLLQRSEKEEKSNTQETEKRINTLFGILRGLVKVIFYVLFIMVFLHKLNVNIGPLLASAGILGLAVGFVDIPIFRVIINVLFYSFV
jgi:moderate conductance mechanosensitive channel